MADQVAEVKSKVDIVSVIGSRVELKRAGKNMRGLCPFHVEKTPSFFVSPDMQSFKCFGCGKGGDCFTFLEEYEGMTFREALEYLAEKVGVRLESYQPTGGESLRKRGLEILNLAKEYYRYVLKSHPAGKAGREYLDKRGVDLAMREKFNLGFAPESWDSLYKFLVVKKKYPAEEVERVGLIIGSTRSMGSTKSTRGYYDRFRGRVMFPLTDFRGRVVGFSGRVIDPDVKEAKYVNTPETDWYHKRELLFGIDLAKEAIRKKNRAIVVEGELDVMSSVAAGVVNVVGVKGSALTEDHVKLLARITRKVVLCLDADAAGDSATKRGIEVADKLGMDVEVLPLVGGKDPDEIVREDPGAWKKLAEKSISIFEFYIQSAFSRNDGEMALGKKRISEELAPVLAKITNKVEQAHYVGQVAGRLGVAEDALRSEMEKAVKGEEIGKKTAAGPEEREEKADRLAMLEKYGWGLVLALTGKEFLAGWELVSELSWRNPGLKRLSAEMEKYLTKKDKFEVSVWVKLLPVELAKLVGEMYLQEEVVKLKDEEGILKELTKVVGELKKEGAKQRLAELTSAIREGERKGEEDLGAYQEEYSRLVKLLRE